MRFFLPKSSRFEQSRTIRCKAAFTLVDLMVSLGLFMLVMFVVIYAHLSGLKMYQLASAKLSASQDARRTINEITEDIRTAGNVRIGTGDETTFSQTAVHTLQQGNALRIFPDRDDTNTYVQYFRDASTDQFKRLSTDDESVSVIAEGVTNEIIFAAENYNGQVLTNYFNTRVIAMQLQFSQETSGAGQLRDFYQLRTKITRRSQE